MTTLAINIDVCIMILKKVVLLSFIFISLNSSAQEAVSVKASVGEDLRVYPVLWHQLSPEYMALCYQAFNVAQSNLELELKNQECCEKLAIVTDIDETVLDNSYSEARNIVEGKSYNPKDWTAWIDEASATGVPGALEFLRWAASKGVTVFYISNRTPRDIPATVKNLKNLNFPFADEEHMLFLADGSTKEPRREKVAENYKIVMLLGDNLNDFAACFEVKDNQKRRDAVQELRQEWGRRFIVIPNVIYGEWEKGIYDYKSGLSAEEKESMRRGKLKVNP
ncbi:MAG: 5'-nucleotidase, lipoprotein e(P4) family [Rikenellaceae bacterium]|nr:5'-nucleotidase, lipoprotein e(P4) family [Rikenellaceae bacterium]